MKQILLSKNQFAIVDDEDFEYLNQFKWCLFNGYAGRMDKKRQISMHRYLMNTPEKMVCDHINGRKLDNRKENLRNCTQGQNCMNRRKDLKGIIHERGKWTAKIVCIESGIKKQRRLGKFGNKQDAYDAYDKAAKFYFGEYAALNSENKNV